ncbi:MAG: PEP-CTERM sorting domain-containing protein [Okeania sp. SIO3B5]|uniref:hypothetical protein n=1 Tax=Okeania sp. SIO3B5 TaxID=2607811 RepID=UPI0013FFFCE7|nr:hypothetical protein [Okeania sp. SIO3B5]NEO56239.1 PEP-CTERM sorting domain-containing protein [Okeania sp. SIO3B5]
MMLKKFSIAIAGAGAAIAATFTTVSSASAIVNGSFEAGFNGWSTIGDTRIEDISFGTPPSDGNFNALMTNGFGAVSDFAIENFLGLTPGTLDSSLNIIDATEGSAIKQTFFAKAGDILTFDFNFLTDEFTPDFFFNDSSFISLSNLDVLADTNSSVMFSLTSFFEETGYQSFSHTFSESGTYTLGFGVVDAVDTVVDSGLLIDNVELTSVPEPGLIFGLSLIGTLGATSLKGKQKKEM